MSDSSARLPWCNVCLANIAERMFAFLFPEATPLNNPNAKTNHKLCFNWPGQRLQEIEATGHIASWKVKVRTQSGRTRQRPKQKRARLGQKSKIGKQKELDILASKISYRLPVPGNSALLVLCMY